MTARSSASTPAQSDSQGSLFGQIAEVALRMNDGPGTIVHSVTHEFYATESGRVRTATCPHADCGATYALGFSRSHGTQRFFEDLSGELTLRLNDDHAVNRKHRSLIAIGWV